jgi:hypothetical protein
MTGPDRAGPATTGQNGGSSSERSLSNADPHTVETVPRRPVRRVFWLVQHRFQCGTDSEPMRNRFGMNANGFPIGFRYENAVTWGVWWCLPARPVPTLCGFADHRGWGPGEREATTKQLRAKGNQRPQRETTRRGTTKEGWGADAAVGRAGRVGRCAASGGVFARQDVLSAGSIHAVYVTGSRRDHKRKIKPGQV